jgi:hypothetical protein
MLDLTIKPIFDHVVSLLESIHPLAKGSRGDRSHFDLTIFREMVVFMAWISLKGWFLIV